MHAQHTNNDSNEPVILVKIRAEGRVIARQTFEYLVEAQQWADAERRKYGIGATEEIIMNYKPK